MSEKIHFYWEKPIPAMMIVDTWEASYKRKMPGEYWTWRFEKNPFSDRVTVAYIMDKSVLACYYAVSPVLVKIRDGRTVKSGLMNMGFTHPDYQKKGYYIKVNNALHDKLKSEGYIGVFGFANHNSHYVYRKYLDWKDLSILNVMSVNGDTYRASSRPEIDIDVTMEKIDETKTDKIMNFIVAEDKIHVLRNKDYLVWRLVQNPVNQYECLEIRKDSVLLALMVFKRFGQEVDIMEYFFIDKNKDLNYLMFSEGVRFFLKQGAGNICIWSNLHSTEHVFLEKIGFQEGTFSTYFGCIPFSNCPDFSAFPNWHYRFIDSDVY